MCCGYMIKRMNFDAESAILRFESTRDHKIESTRNAILKLKKE